MKSQPLNQKYCALPKISKKNCCSSKIVDFRALKNIAAQTEIYKLMLHFFLIVEKHNF